MPTNNRILQISQLTYTIVISYFKSTFLYNYRTCMYTSFCSTISPTGYCTVCYVQYCTRTCQWILNCTLTTVVSILSMQNYSRGFIYYDKIIMIINKFPYLNFILSIASQGAVHWATAGGHTLELTLMLSIHIVHVAHYPSILHMFRSLLHIIQYVYIKLHQI